MPYGENTHVDEICSGMNCRVLSHEFSVKESTEKEEEIHLSVYGDTPESAKILSIML